MRYFQPGWVNVVKEAEEAATWAQRHLAARQLQELMRVGILFLYGSVFNA